MTGDSRYILREATPAELEQTRRGHAASWALGLTEEQYLGREIHITANLSTEYGGMKCWILTPLAEPCRILSSCETIGKPAVVRSVKGGREQVRTVPSYVIGSVFTPEQNRGNGYASVMIDLLAQKLSTECEFDALYSDVGKKFYARKGWKPHPSHHISLPPAEKEEEPVPGVKLLEAQDLPQLCSKDVDSILSSYNETPLPPNVDARIAYLPTYDTMKWHHAREEYLGKQFIGKTPIIKGALSTSGKTWCIWNRFFNSLDHSYQKISILRMVDMGSNNMQEEERVDEIVALLKAAQEQARLWRMKEVLVWSPDERTIKAVGKILRRPVEVIERETDNICSLRWNGEEGPDANVIWDLNEKYAWC